MEQDVETRYCFMMLLAIADSGGYVIGTDVAIARTINVPLDVFTRCVEKLKSPDDDSNSQVLDGRRIVDSDAGRGYRVVNYLTYRALKSEEEKKTYMREYMRNRRQNTQTVKNVKSVKICKSVLSDVTHTEEEGEGDTEVKPSLQQKASPSGLEGDEKEKQFNRFWNAYPKRKGRGNALKAWTKQKLDSKIETILEAIQRLKKDEQWTKNGGQYIPHPATWLNSGGWDDEITIFTHNKGGNIYTGPTL